MNIIYKLIKNTGVLPSSFLAFTIDREHVHLVNKISTNSNDSTGADFMHARCKGVFRLVSYRSISTNRFSMITFTVLVSPM